MEPAGRRVRTTRTAARASSSSCVTEASPLPASRTLGAVKVTNVVSPVAASHMCLPLLTSREQPCPS